MPHLRFSLAAMALILCATGSASAESPTASTSSTTSTTGVFGIEATLTDNRCVVWFRLTSAVDVSNVDFTVNYGPADGSFLGEGSEVECARAFGGQGLVAYRDRDVDGVREFRASVVRVNNFTGPQDLAACRWLFNDAPPLVADFSTIVTNAGYRNPDTGDVDDLRPLPKVRVDRVVCPGTLPDGLTTTTTTTMTRVTTTSTVSSTTLPVVGGGCGLPVSGGSSPKASDALFTLQAAVGLRTCPLCVCDVDSSGGLGASDALAILRAAVGGNATLDCVDCLF